MSTLVYSIKLCCLGVSLAGGLSEAKALTIYATKGTKLPDSKIVKLNEAKYTGKNALFLIRGVLCLTFSLKAILRRYCYES